MFQCRIQIFTLGDFFTQQNTCLDVHKSGRKHFSLPHLGTCTSVTAECRPLTRIYWQRGMHTAQTCTWSLWHTEIFDCKHFSRSGGLDHVGGSVCLVLELVNFTNDLIARKRCRNATLLNLHAEKRHCKNVWSDRESNTGRPDGRPAYYPLH